MKPLVEPADLSALRRWRAPERLVEHQREGDEYARLSIPGARRPLYPTLLAIAAAVCFTGLILAAVLGQHASPQSAVIEAPR